MGVAALTMAVAIHAAMAAGSAARGEISTPALATTHHVKISARTRRYPLHREITATVFWVGEHKGGGSSEDNAYSAFDDSWLSHFGGVDDPYHRHGYDPAGFSPLENPFYLDLPYSDVGNAGSPRRARTHAIPWAHGGRDPGPRNSLMKNRWVELGKGPSTCYGQIEDAGPYVYDDVRYVFGSGRVRPRSHRANSAGIDVSPALRDCLHFREMNGQDDRVNWRFIDGAAVPNGPWRQLVTTRQRFCIGGC
ncbi:MAG: hypothetical protein NVSMB25_13520 [Thermoleophilaceae bacterium]